jgi:hypothetical protein
LANEAVAALTTQLEEHDSALRTLREQAARRDEKHLADLTAQRDEWASEKQRLRREAAAAATARVDRLVEEHAAELARCKAAAAVKERQLADELDAANVAAQELQCATQAHKAALAVLRREHSAEKAKLTRTAVTAARQHSTALTMQAEKHRLQVERLQQSTKRQQIESANALRVQQTRSTAAEATLRRQHGTFVVPAV